MIDEEIASKCIKRNDLLSDFLQDCAGEIYARKYRAVDSVFVDIDVLKDQEIVDLVDYWKKHHVEKKYTMQVFKNNDIGYLNCDETNEFFLDNRYEYGQAQTRFTKQELEQLKQRDDIAIDWDKAVIKPARDE